MLLLLGCDGSLSSPKILCKEHASIHVWEIQPFYALSMCYIHFNEDTVVGRKYPVGRNSTL
jgi:hypothetical protein